MKVQYAVLTRMDVNHSVLNMSFLSLIWKL